MKGILMSTHNIHVHDKKKKKKKKKNMKIALYICFLELSEEFFYGLKNMFNSATVDEPSVFEPFKYYCSSIMLLYLHVCNVVTPSLKHIIYNIILTPLNSTFI